MSIEVIKEVITKGWIPVTNKDRREIESFLGTTKGIMVSYLEEHTERWLFM